MRNKYSEKATLKPPGLQKKKKWKELVNKKMLRKFMFPVTVYHILNCVGKGWDFGFCWGFFLVEPYFNPDSSN